MRKQLTDDIELRNLILAGLKENEGYCPCIYQSKGKPEYKCPCKEFRELIKPGEFCYCGLYIKV